jgi:predicted RNase H-like nuclease
MSAAAIWLAGVDGCRTGWIVAFLRPSAYPGEVDAGSPKRICANRKVEEVRVRIVPRFADVLAAPEAPAVVAVDMPIGLPDRIGPDGRGPERAIRPLLGARQSSVFPVPPRAAIFADDFGAACAAALAASEPPRKVSKQLFMIAPKIREVDECLRRDPRDVARVHEVHPEFAFWRLNGGRALGEPKKVKGVGYAPGLALRRSLLIAAGLPTAIVAAPPPKGAGADDLLDALACAAIARRLHAGSAQSFPDPPGRDAFGLPVAIWA